MNQELIFNFKTDLSKIEIPVNLNNPFSSSIPEIGRIAANEFQEYIMAASQDWDYNFATLKGKMFGVLVIQKEDDSYGYLGTVSGKLPGNTIYNKLAPAVFDEATDNFFMSRGLTELTAMSSEIQKSNLSEDILQLIEKRKLKSIELQQRLFENTQLFNIKGVNKNVLQIFEESSHAYPPAAAGECAAPKLFQYAFKHELLPIAIAEFWWGNRAKNKEREHKCFYPACKNKCRPILEFMLDDEQLFSSAY